MTVTLCSLDSLKRALLVIAAIAAVPTPGSAQSNGLGYVFIGAVPTGGYNGPATHFGGGGEAISTKGVGIGGEIGTIAYSSPYRTDRMGVFSFNVSAHANPDASPTAQPFFTGGLTALVQRQTITMFNLGAGVDLWTTPSVGVRLELRSHIYAEGFALTSFRIGVVFR